MTDVDGPNKDAEFNLAHLPSDAVVARGMGTGAETGRNGASGLEADKTYIIRTVGSAENYEDNVKAQKVVIFSRERLLFIAKMVAIRQKRQVP